MAQGKKTGGRRKGTLNAATREIKAVANRLLTDRDYMTSLRLRLRSGEIAPAVEVLLYHYAYGQPTKKVELSGTLTLEEIIAGKRRGGTE
jgi:hypothetical protein